MLDATDGFSGLAASCIEHMYDEFGKSVVAFPIIPSYYDDYNHQTAEERAKSIMKDSMRVLNLSFCFESLKENSSLFVPLSTGEKGWRQPGNKREFHHINYNVSSGFKNPMNVTLYLHENLFVFVSARTVLPF